MASKRDFYEVLGVTKGATEVEIKQAFRARARQYHPDVSKEDEAETRFKEINEAYEVLGDQRKRAAYDRFGHAGVSSTGQGYNGFEGFADIFDQFFGAGGRRTQRGPQRGADLRYDLSITFEEAVFGVEKVLDIPALRSCSRCSGSGAEPNSGQTVCSTCHGSGEIRRVQQSVFGQFVNVVMCDRCQGEGQIAGAPCKQCRGQGRERENRRVTVKIPAGVDNGQQIRVQGDGEAGPKGGPAGDLYVVLEVSEHMLFQRDGAHVQYEMPVTLTQAVLGDQITVPTLDGSEEVKLSAGTQSGYTIRLKNRGIPYLRGSGRGDMYVVVRVVIPTKLTADQKSHFEAIAATLELENVEDKGFFDRVKEAFGA